MAAAQIHASAIVDEGAQIGEGSRIWHWVHVSGGARIGRNCSLGQNVYVGNRVVIGDNVKIQNNVSVYDEVTLEDDVFCGPSMVFTNVYNPRSAVPRKDQYRRTLVRRGATLGANCTVVCGVTIGAYAFVGAGAVVNRDVPDYALMLGVPARHAGWMSRFGERLPLPLAGEGEARCPHTGERYLLRGGRCALAGAVAEQPA
jgi:UDP-2-acetamido-3-amino-2,3-dideoxy-glucuronate N-acetyltransferase